MITQPPFFILGCVRSGTTMLRDFLRLHPNLCSPEETHFFRTASPYGSVENTNFLRNSPVLAIHRQMDGISEEEFRLMLRTCTSRAALQRKYMQTFAERNKPAATRWFDKTPQNVYGLMMIRQAFPGAKYIHIVRNPFNVVASLREGKIMKIDSLVGACNSWNEALDILNAARPSLGKRLLEIKYEEVVKNPHESLREILDFLGEEPAESYFRHIRTTVRKYPDDYFSTEELKRIQKLCGHWLDVYGFSHTGRD